ncbi:MAG: glucose 1-dehydrogenase [Anaerolineae bacterium]|nr:glucose 1-dehydrogenase [Anaerolineae bacterium]
MDIATVFESIRPRYPEFKDQVALITGSSRGIGKGIALRLSREGMKIVVHGINQQEIDTTTQEFQSLGVETISVNANFSVAEDVERLFKTTLDHFGRLDLLVNNAADLFRYHFFDPNAEKRLDVQLAVNIRAPYILAMRAAEIMRASKRGTIINISSVGGFRAHWEGLPYDMTKGAIDAMTRAMALDLAQEGIRINAIAPGAIDVERVPPANPEQMREIAKRLPIPRFGTTLEIGAAVAFLASEDASYITGQVIYVDGGLTTQLSPPGTPV